MLQEDEDIALASVADKGKRKEREEFGLGDDKGHEPLYPPMSEDAEETRRVEENLRRWEVAERQRRKAARESQSHSASSLVLDVSRRASLLFAGRRGKMNSVSTLGHHAALQSQDNIDVVPLTYESRHILETSSAVSEREQDPFANLSAPVPQLTISPFDDVHAAPDSISPASPTLSTPTKEGLRRYRTRRPSPPRPLNLPPPRSPPPIFLMEEGEGDNSQDATTDVRWWHEWLCGCGEGPDRGGDVQAGRTNPLE